jgi:aspartyl-tRNA(Asn)/glutamyl-tRNA(Gln) amidotransferase subunit C
MDNEIVSHLAKLARIDMSKESAEERQRFNQSLSNIFKHMESLNAVNTDSIEPMYHAMDLNQRLAPDVVSEVNERELFQSIAPSDAAGKSVVIAGLYLVPKVID